MSNSNKHELHKAVADCIMNCGLPERDILKDPACGGNQNVPLFYTDVKSRATRYSVVDMIILKNDRIKVIIEIEENFLLQLCLAVLFTSLEVINLLKWINQLHLYKFVVQKS